MLGILIHDKAKIAEIDVLRDMEKAGEIGSIHPYFYSTVGNGTAVASAKKYGTEIGQKLVDDHVDAVILTST